MRSQGKRAKADARDVEDDEHNDVCQKCGKGGASMANLSSSGARARVRVVRKAATEGVGVFEPVLLTCRMLTRRCSHHVHPLVARPGLHPSQACSCVAAGAILCTISAALVWQKHLKVLARFGEKACVCLVSLFHRVPVPASR